NSLRLLITPFDPYPYLCLNLVLSCLAAVQAPVILMSLNRQAARDRLDAELDDARSSRAETDVEQLHEKLDVLREKQWRELVELQQHQIALLNQILGSEDEPPPPASDVRRHRRARVVDGQTHVRRQRWTGQAGLPGGEGGPA